MKKNNLLTIFLPLYFVIGMLKGMSIFEHTDYILSILIQLLVLFILIKEKKQINKKFFSLYVANILLILIIGIYFMVIDCEFSLIINRILPLFSIYGLIIILVRRNEINFKEIINNTINLFSILGIIIIFDIICYLIFSKSIWPPISYLGNRFSGPFYDSNFMAITYGVILITALYMEMKHKKEIILISIICILAAKSWSTIIFIILTILIHLVLKINFKNLFLKQIIFIIVDILFIIVFHKYNTDLSKIFMKMLSGTNFSVAEIMAKFKSLDLRITAQYSALKLFIVSPLGHGPRTIVTYLGMDIHNSYIGFLFEQGIFGGLLQIINMPAINSNEKFSDTITTFIIMVAFFINIHYLSIFVFVILTVLTCKEGGENDNIFNNSASL